MFSSQFSIRRAVVTAARTRGIKHGACYCVNTSSSCILLGRNSRRGVPVARQTSRAKLTLPHSVIRDKTQPKATIAETAALIKIGGVVYKAVDTVAEAFEGETIFSVYVRNSFAIHDKHKIDLTIKNVTGHGLYIEAVSVHIPKPKKQDSSIANDGVLGVRFSLTPIKTAGLDVPPLDSAVAATAFFPRRIAPLEQLDFRITRDLLDRKSFQERPYLQAKIVFSKLDAKAEDDADIPFRIRWN